MLQVRFPILKFIDHFHLNLSFPTALLPIIIFMMLSYCLLFILPNLKILSLLIKFIQAFFHPSQSNSIHHWPQRFLSACLFSPLLHYYRPNHFYLPGLTRSFLSYLVLFSTISSIFNYQSAPLPLLFDHWHLRPPTSFLRLTLLNFSCPAPFLFHQRLPSFHQLLEIWHHPDYLLQPILP